MRRSACLVVLALALPALLVAAQPAVAGPVLSVQQGTTPIAKSSTYTFPSTTPVGTPVSVLFTISNTGNANLTLGNASSLVSGNAAFSEIAVPTTPVAAGGNTTFRVRLQGGAPGTFTGTVSIASNDPVNPTFTFTVQGTVTGPSISVQQGTTQIPKGSTYTFPASTPVGVPVSVLFTVSNTGSAPLNLGNASSLVSGNAAFSEIAVPTTPVAAGGNTTFRVRLQGGAAGTFTGTVSIASDDPVNPTFTFTVQGTVTGPSISVQQGTTQIPKGSTYTFPASTPVGVPVSVLFTISNTGSAPLNLGNASTLVSGNAAFSEIAIPTTPVAAGGNTTFRVRLQGGTAGTFTGTVSIASDDPVNPTFTFTVQGTVTGPSISVQQGTTQIPKGSTYTFPASTPVGVPVSVLFTISNTGSAPLNLGNASSLVSGNAAFSEIAVPTTPVAVGGNTTFRVRLQGGFPGTVTGTVSIASDDPVNPTFTFTVQGTVTGPSISAQQGTTQIAKGSTYTFPSTTVGTPVSMLFTISNTGSGALNISNPATLVSCAAFSEIAAPVTPVAAGGTTTFRVRLQSATPGTFTCTVTITSDDPVNPTFTFTIVGTVTAPAISVQAGTTQIANGSTYTFPATPVGSPVSVPFTISNTGNAPLNLGNPGSLVSGNAAFSEIATPATPVNDSGGTTTFRVRLQGGFPGTVTGTVTIASDDPVHPTFTFTIVGTVTAPAISVQAGTTQIANGSTYTFPASTPVGVATSVLFTITDTGSAALNLGNPGTLVSGNAAFSEILTPVTPVNANSGTTSFRVRLQGGFPGTVTGTVTIASDDPVTPTFTFTIVGTVTPAPAIGVEQGSTAIANGSTFPLPATLTGVAETVTFTIGNTGTADLHLANPTALVTGSCFSESQTPTTPVVASGATSFAVQVLSSAAGTCTGTVTIASDDPINGTFTFTVTATVSQAPHLRIVEAWNGTTIVPGGTVTFPDEDPGAAESLQLLLVNDGPGSLTVNNPNALVSGGAFTQLTVGPSSLVVNQNAGVLVRMQGGFAGVQSGSFSVSSNDPQNPTYSVNLTGAIGLTLPPLRVESGDGVFVTHEGTYAFPDTGVDQPESRAFTIFNDGTQDFVIANPLAMVSGDVAFNELVQPASATIHAGGSQVVRVQLQSSTPGAHYGEVTIASADPTEKPFLFTVTGNVQSPDFKVTVSPASRGLVQGQNVSYTVTVTNLFGFDSDVTLTLSGLDPNSNHTFSQPDIPAGGGTSSMRIYTSSATPAGTQTLTVNATGGGISHSASVTLTVSAAADFSLASIPSAQTAQVGQTANYTVDVNGAAGFASPVTLAVSAGLPPNATATFNPPTASPSAPSTLSVATTASTPIGGYSLTIQGTSGALSHTATAGLTVTATPATGAPVVQGVTPSTFVNGQQVTVTITGQNLQGTVVTVPTGQATPSSPVTRTFPTAQLQSVSSDGTSMQVLIDATDTRTLDYYNLQIKSSAGQQAAQIRVLPQGPVADLWAPRYVAPGYTFLLSIVGYHLTGATVSTDAPGAVTIFGVANTDDDHLTGILQVDDGAALGTVHMIVQGAGGQLILPVSIVSPSTLLSPSSMTGQVKSLAVSAPPGKAAPKLLFAPYEMRRPGSTRVSAEGLRVEEQAARASRTTPDDVTFYTYINVPLITFEYQQALLFDPVTNKISGTLLQGLAPGVPTRFGAFVLSVFFEADLTIYFGIDVETGDFTFPLFCVHFLSADEIPGLQGFYLDLDFCFGGQRGSFSSGATSNLTISGGQCAQVSQEGPPADGLAYGDITLNSCCSQPIEIQASGTTFTGTSFGTSFDITTPDAGTATPIPGNCSCPCTVSLDQQITLQPKMSKTLTAAVLANQGTNTCIYEWSLTQSRGLLGLQLPQNPSPVTVSPSGQVNLQPQVTFPPGISAQDNQTQLTLSASGLPVDAPAGTQPTTCTTQPSDVCAIPANETSLFFQQPNQSVSIAQFIGVAGFIDTDFSGRQQTEGNKGSGTYDLCWFPGSAVTQYTDDNAIRVAPTAIYFSSDPQNGYQDSIGIPQDLPSYYGNSHNGVGCAMGTSQNERIYCPWDDQTQLLNATHYWDNVVTILIAPNSVTITRNGEQSPNLHHP